MADEELRLEVSAQVDKFVSELDKATEAVNRLYHEGASIDEVTRKMDSQFSKISGSLRDFSSSVKQASGATKDMSGAAKTQDMSLKQANAAWDKQNRIYEDYLQHQEKATQATNEFNNSIISQRYALYDVATTYGAISAALLGISTLALKTGADFERAFSDVERTVDFSTTSSQIAGIREELIELSTTIPKSFEDLSQIATLGNQLGIASEDITAFTETVAQFSTIAGISVEETALAFGQLGNLLGVGADEYHRLGSAIALVGVNSAATEKQIVSIAREIAPAARAAGFTADQVVGLSGALGSIRVPPERSRSTILQFFETLNMAAANGGDRLENFAKIVGTTSSELTRMINAGMGEEILRRFITTMGAAESETVEITQALQALGLAGLRTNPTIRALSDNVALMNQTFADGAAGFASGTEQARQFQIIADDLVSELQMFVNAINALVEAATGGLVPGLAAAVRQTTEFVNSIREFVASDAGQAVTRLGMSLMTLVGIYAAIRAAAALASASTLALAYANAAAGSTGLLSNLRLMISALLGYTKVVDGAVVSTLTLRGALFALGRATLIFGIVQVAVEYLLNFNEAMATTIEVLAPLGHFANDAAIGFGNFISGIEAAIGPVLSLIVGLQGLGDRISSLGKTGKAGISMAQDWGKELRAAAKAARDDLSPALGSVASYTPDMGALSGSIADIGSSASDAGGAVKDLGEKVYTLVDYASDLGSVMSRAFDIRFGSQTAMDTVTQRWIDLNNEMEDYREQVRKLQADRAVTAYFLSVAEAYGDTVRAGVLRAELAEIDRDLEDATAAVSGELEGNSAAAIKNRGTVRDLVGMYQQHIEKLAAAGADQEELNKAIDASEEEFLAQGRALGFADDELRPYVQSFRDMKTVVEQIPRNVTTTIDARNDPAMAAIDEFEARMRNLNNQTFGGGTIAAPTIQQPAPMTWAQWSQQNMRGISTSASQAQWDAYIAQGRYWYERYLRGFREGGYTGNAGQSAPAGVVHGQEFVFTAEATRNAGVSNLYSMMRAFEQGRGYRQGGFVSPTPVAMPTSTGPNVVILDQAQFHALVNSGQVNVQIGSEQIAGAVNRQNTQYANLGRG